MKRTFKAVAAVVCAAVMAAPLAACAKSTKLGGPSLQKLDNYYGASEGYLAMREGAEEFASRFAPAVYADYDGDDNFVVSPLSVYMGLSLAAQSAAGQTREEIVSALGVSYATLSEHISDFYRGLYKDYDSPKGMLQLGNSVWVNEGTPTNRDCIDTLADKFYCYSYMADFANDNASANQAVRQFVKEQTHGLIDNDYQLSTETLFALINTLYLKDVWNGGGDDIALTDKNYTFTQDDGTAKELKLMRSDYRQGRAYRGENFTSFYTTTYRGYRIKFLLPDEGVAVEDVFTADNIAQANGVADYGGVDDGARKEYFTRCLFPQFEGGYDGDVAAILQDKFGVEKLFDIDSCDLSTLTEVPAYCTQVSHSAKLKVDRTGIEGAAVTVVAVGDTAIEPVAYEKVYLDFVLDRSFGFVLTDSYNTTLFSGVVNKV